MLDDSRELVPCVARKGMLRSFEPQAVLCFHMPINTPLPPQSMQTIYSKPSFALKVVIVHSLSSGKVATTPILKSVPSHFRLLFSKLQSRGTLTRQFSPKVAHKGRDKKKITTIYCLWMTNNQRGREWK